MKSFIFKTLLALAATFLFNFYLLGQSLTVMTYNIRYDNPNDKENWWQHRKTDVAQLIDYYHPDIVGTQEGLIHQLDYINEHTTHYTYIGVGRDDGQKKGEFTAIFYDTRKLEILEDKTFWLSTTPDQISVGWDASMERICTYAKFRILESKVVIHVFNTHFDHIGPKAREESARLLLSKIEEFGLQNEKVVVMGDLNSEPKNLPITLLSAELSDGLKYAEKKFYGPIGTSNQFDISHIPNKRIDYIFTKNFITKEYRHIDDRRTNNLWVSDHLPVLSIIE